MPGFGSKSKDSQGHGSRNHGHQETDVENWTWLKEEIKNIKLQVEQANNVNKKMEEKLQHMELKLERKIGDSIAMLYKDLDDRINKLTIKVQENEKAMYQMNEACERNYFILDKKFQKHMILNDLYSKRQNLILYGIPEKPNESKQETFQSVNKFIKEQLKIEKEIKLIDCHRLNQKKNVDDRSKRQATPIIIRLSNIFDKDCIFRHLKNLKPTDGTKQRISVHNQLPTPMYIQKKKLTEKFKTARLNKQKFRWMIDYNTADYILEIDGSKFYAEKEQTTF